MGKLWNWCWPDVSNQENALRAIKKSFWVAVFVSFTLAALVVPTALRVSFPGFSPWALIDVGVFSLVAVGIHKKSRVASVAAVLLYLSEAVYDGSGTVLISLTNLIALIFVLASVQTLVHGVRGALAYQRLRKEPDVSIEDSKNDRSIRKRRAYFLNWIVHHRVGTRSIAWLLLAAFAFVIAARLTRRIAFVSAVLGRADRPGTVFAEQKAWYYIGVFAERGTNGYAVMNYDYGSGEGKVSLAFVLPRGTKKMRLWQMRPSDHCSYQSLAKSGYGEILPDSRFGDEFDGFIDLDLPELEPDAVILCDIAPHFLEETFVSSVSLFATGGHTPPVAQELNQIPLHITMNSRDGTSEPVSGFSHGPEGTIVIQPNSSSIVRFRSIRREEDRDWYLVLIGAFVALGAALLLEALRPYIERIGRASETS